MEDLMGHDLRRLRGEDLRNDMLLAKVEAQNSEDAMKCLVCRFRNITSVYYSKI